MKVKIIVGATPGLRALVALKLTIKNYDHFFVAVEAIRAFGVLVLNHVSLCNICSVIFYISIQMCMYCIHVHYSSVCFHSLMNREI